VALLTRYVLEGLLQRPGKSKHRDGLALKAAGSMIRTARHAII
jgi:hypothetical protein